VLTQRVILNLFQDLGSIAHDQSTIPAFAGKTVVLLTQRVILNLFQDLGSIAHDQATIPAFAGKTVVLLTQPRHPEFISGPRIDCA
jgi:nicotinate-nucleotide pyrophosphorylase